MFGVCVCYNFCVLFCFPTIQLLQLLVFHTIKMKSHTYSHRFSVDLWFSLQFWMQYTEWHPFLMAILMMRTHLRFSSMCVDHSILSFFVVKQFMGHTHNFRLSFSLSLFLFFSFFSNERTEEKSTHNLTRTERTLQMRVCELRMCIKDWIISFLQNVLKKSRVFIPPSLHFTTLYTRFYKCV